MITALLFTFEKVRRRKNVHEEEQKRISEDSYNPEPWTPPPTQEMDAREQPELDSRVRAEMNA